MLQKPLIKIRDLKELQSSQKKKAESENLITPLKEKKPRKPKASAKSRKNEEQVAEVVETSVIAAKPAPSTVKRGLKNREPPPNQKRIDTFFKTCQKSYKIEPVKEEPTPRKALTEIKGKKVTNVNTTTKKSTKPAKSRTAGRKRLFADDDKSTDIEEEAISSTKASKNVKNNDCINLISDSEGEAEEKTATKNAIEKLSQKSGCKNGILKTSNVLQTPQSTSNANSGNKSNANSRSTSRSKSNKDLENQTKHLSPPTSKPVESTAANEAACSSGNKSLFPPLGIASDNLTKELVPKRMSPRTSARTLTAITSEGTSNPLESSTKALCNSNLAKDVSNRMAPRTASHNSPDKSAKDTSKPLVTMSSLRSRSALKTPTTSRRKPKPCPPYKIIEGSTFAVDAFQYGAIEGVTHYFLTHFHADHYIGLTRKFAMPLYLSPITARLVQSFIPLDEQYINILPLNTTITVNNTEITALDANHCPGAIMILFRFIDTGKYILHTGDFRAHFGMESEPVFWNNDIHTIYLDTTYISNKYAFCTQYESIERAKGLVNTFREKHSNKRILYVCGSYVIGKEKFWSALAEEYDLKVWTEANRSKALKALEDDELNKLLIDDPFVATMHVIAMGKLSYLTLVEYFATYEHQYDMLLAIRPSGWEKDSRPQYRGKINIIGVEYSEHSSYEEMQRFVKFLKPQQVISTVPSGHGDLMKTAKVPEKWYKYEKPHSSSNYQPRIEQFLGKTPQRKLNIRMPNENRGGVDNFVSPLKQKNAIKTANKDSNNNLPEKVISIHSSEHEFEAVAGQIKPISKENLASSAVSIKEELLPNNPNAKVVGNQLQHAPSTISPAADNDEDLILSQHLNEGDSCSIFITKSIEPLVTKTNSSIKSSPLLRLRKRGIIESSSSAEDMPVSQKRNTPRSNGKIKKTAKTNLAGAEKLAISQQNNAAIRDKSKKQITEPSIRTDEEITVAPKRFTRTARKILSSSSEEDFVPTQNGNNNHIDKPKVLLESIQEHAEWQIANDDMPTTSKMAKIMASQRNSMLKSNTTSYASSPNETVQRSQTNSDISARPFKSKAKFFNALDLLPEKIPASQTTVDLERTPRPLRNKFRAHTKYSSENEQIPDSQSSKDLGKTTRSLRNKRNHKSPALAVSPPKKSKEDSDSNSTVFSQSNILTQILKQNQNIDIYNPSQLISLVAETLANNEQTAGNNNHIPKELFTDYETATSHSSQEYKSMPRSIGKESDKARRATPNAISAENEIDDLSLASSLQKSMQCDENVVTPQRNRSVSRMSSTLEEHTQSREMSNTDDIETPKRPTSKLSYTFLNSPSEKTPEASIADLTQMFIENENTNIYETAEVLMNILASQKVDTSVEHIPRELLSSPDAEDDWLA